MKLKVNGREIDRERSNESKSNSEDNELMLFTLNLAEGITDVAA